MPIRHRGANGDRVGGVRGAARLAATKGCLVAALIGLAASTGGRAGAESLRDFQGSWEITDVVGYDTVSSGVPGARKLLGASITITDHDLRIAGQRCVPLDVFTVASVAAAPRAREIYGINARDAGLPKRAWLLDGPNCSPVFLLDRHRILFGWLGVVVRAYRR